MRDDRQSFFEQLREVALVTPSDIVDEWTAIARRSEPWRSMPLDDLVGELPAVLTALFREERWSEHQNPNLLELRARSHGSFRRRQGIAAPALTEESVMLTAALRAVLEFLGASESTSHDVVALIERDLGLVTRSANAGYFDGPSSPRL